MDKKIDVSISEIDITSPYLVLVKALWRKHSKTLGYLPDGAFNDYAHNRGIIFAATSEQALAGYLLYRVTGNEAHIVHLCTDSKFRKQGVARSLVNYLIQKTTHLIGIRLNCRSDFEENAIWPRLGFHVVGEKPGRSKKGNELTRWRLSYGHPDLFTTSAMQHSDAVLRVVIDANVFFDISNPSAEENPTLIESKSLLADWLRDAVDLWLTDEIFNEIQRNKNSIERERRRRSAQEYPHVLDQPGDFEFAQRQVRALFPERISESDESDVKQLAKAIAGGVQFFVTRDDELLERADTIYEKLYVTVLRPADLIIRLDELRRETAYQPSRLAGTDLSLSLVQAKQEALLTAHFHSTGSSETKTSFQQRLRRYLAEPSRFQCLTIASPLTNPLGLIVYDSFEPHILSIPLLRVYPGKLAPTLAHHLISRTILRASHERKLFTKLTERFPDGNVTDALGEAGFVLVNDGWLKVNLSVIDTAQNIAAQLNACGDRYNYDVCRQIAELLEAPSALADVDVISDCEHRLWPAKIADADIPTFIVPIRPEWARHLFDEELANQQMFGARADLALNFEAVYYRSSKPAVVTAPGRILWYVSQGKKQYQGVGQIRACSRLDEVVIGKPKELYRRFRRLGIYEWLDVYKTAKYDLDRDIMALQFSDTELLDNPISFYAIQEILGRKATLVSPVRISKESFATLYQRATAEKVKVHAS